MNTFLESSGLRAVQGASEQRTKVYLTYIEGAAQLATQQCAKIVGRVNGSAIEQADKAGSF